MKSKCKKQTLAFGEFIAKAWDVYGRREGRKIVRYAVNSRLVVFRSHARVVVVAS
jgi:hypothetical protein